MAEIRSGSVLIALTNGERGDQRRVINLSVEDEATGRFVVNIDLTGPEMTRLIGAYHVRKSGRLLQLHYHLNDEAAVAHLEVYDLDTLTVLVEAHMGGETFATILGNKVTRVENARFAEVSHG